MTTQYTPILQLALPVTGELNGTWGDVVNDNITSMVEEAIAGKASISSWTGASHTLTTADGTTDEARCAMLECTGSPGGAAQLICPARTKMYVVNNLTTGGYTVTLKTSGGTGIAVPNGKSMLLYCDGTNVVDGVSYASSAGTVSGVVAIANGGTNQTSFTAKSGNVAGLVFFDGTSLANDTTVTDVGFDTSTNTLISKNYSLGGAYTETVYALGTSGSIALNPANGTIQTCAASGTVTFTDSLSAGQSIVLMLTGGVANTINWPTTTWVGSSGNTAPTLTASSTLVFWKISTTLYGSYVGSYA